MENEKGDKEIGKKLWSIVRIAVLNPMLLDLNVLLKRGKTASKAIANLMSTHHRRRSQTSCAAALSCRSNDINNSFISPRHYEFSCSNTPRRPKRQNRRRHEDLSIKVFSLLNASGDGATEKTASRSPLEEDNKHQCRHQVDEDAEEFIRRFYRDLMEQKRSPSIAALESPSPSPYHAWAR